MIVSHNMHDNHKLESCHSHEKEFHDFSRTLWEIFIFQDFSMTTIFSRIFHDRGNPAGAAVGPWKPLGGWRSVVYSGGGEWKRFS